ncbi:porin [Noviherbaspirillum sp. UKPF54]|uniref:porin n=1 Tax=Noviherbaspirillum sp. UKPF54 TaxID=2601898 RepID=UPI0011B1BE90|nr:porin [Noviherbaspirillum sp. UKPF54]QDZ30296.1 porin [Noviherbaspirillum sp. UKPF54]
MKKSLLALTALAAIGGTAQAQSNVTIYGIMDAGVEYANNANAAKDSVWRLTSGGQNTSRFGFKGTEDLGGGLKALFQLEGGMFLDSGAGDGPLFKRQANVGLSGAFGSVVAGRSFTTTYDFILPFDPMGYAPGYSWATSGNGTATSKYGMPTAFDNMLKYQGEFNGIKFGASYGFGEVAGNNADSRKYALGIGYAVGPLSVAATYDQANGNTVTATGNRNETTTLHLGAGYKISDSIDVKGGYRSYKLVAGAVNTADVRADTYWGGVNYKATPALELTGAVYYQDVKNVASGTDADPTLYVLRAKYALSKRTFLYATTGYAKAKNNQTVGLTRDSTADGGVTGFSSSQTGFIAGIQHRF